MNINTSKCEINHLINGRITLFYLGFWMIHMHSLECRKAPCTTHPMLTWFAVKTITCKHTHNDSLFCCSSGWQRHLGLPVWWLLSHTPTWIWEDLVWTTNLLDKHFSPSPSFMSSSSLTSHSNFSDTTALPWLDDINISHLPVFPSIPWLSFCCWFSLMFNSPWMNRDIWSWVLWPILIEIFQIITVTSHTI